MAYFKKWLPLLAAAACGAMPAAPDSEPRGSRLWHIHVAGMSKSASGAT